MVNKSVICDVHAEQNYYCPDVLIMSELKINYEQKNYQMNANKQNDYQKLKHINSRLYYVLNFKQLDVGKQWKIDVG